MGFKYRARYNIRILNLSVSASTELPYHIDPLNMALTQAWIQGLVVVVSAGNEGPQPSSVTAPGNNPWLITVGAADYSTDGQWRSVAPFSAAAQPTRDISNPISSLPVRCWPVCDQRTLSDQKANQIISTPKGIGLRAGLPKHRP